MPPPRVFPGHTPGPHGHGPRLKGSEKNARRAVLLQCESCSATGTGFKIGDSLDVGRLPAHWTHDEPCHTGCGGRFLAFDVGGKS